MPQLRVHTFRPDDWNESDAFLQALQDRFEAFDTGVTFVAGVDRPVDDGSLNQVRIDNCAGSPTPAVADLFARFAAGLDPRREFAVFFAHQLLDGLGRPGASGCANHPRGTRGVIVRTGARPLTLAHEVCHFFLGPGHIADSTRTNLMIPAPQTIVGEGELTPAQVARIRAGVAGGLPRPAATVSRTRAKRRKKPGRRRRVTGKKVRRAVVRKPRRQRRARGSAKRRRR